ncbi:MAG: chemotaxis protein CheA, partial [Methylomarinum sp.]|nr:chemotaxis protein CheA [Methylomarinum sp.]
KAEDVFNVLRQGERQVNAELMDVILEVVDIVNLMFDQVKAGNEPEAADDSLLTRLQAFTSAGSAEKTIVESPPEPIVEEKAVVDAPVIADFVEQEFEAMLEDVSESEINAVASDNDEITEDEFDSLLDNLHGKGQFSAQGLQQEPDEATPEQEITAVPVDPGDITEDEFDSLLDELHGKGQFSAASLKEEQVPEAVVDSGDITEEEFDNLLDDLHGKGTFNSSVGAAETKKEEPVEIIKEPELIVPEAESPIKPQPEKQQPKPEAIVETAKVAKATKKPATASQGETTVRVDTQVLDNIMNMVGELVLVRNRFQTLKSSSDTGSSEQMSKAVSNLDVVTADLQLAVMKTRMQPIKKVFGRFPRVVRDLSRSLKKEIKLELVGEETDLDKNLVEALADPLVHLVRNAVDHGIEFPDDRVAAGKPREGVVVLTASQEGDHIMLSIKDDGKGMNADVLRRIVVEKGLMDEETAARLDNRECYNLIFMPGFSTKTEISDVSGRGVGMDVVKTRIIQMNGIVEIDSVEGVGSTITIKVPLTLAIMPTLMVVLGGQAFALPLASVLEILDLDLKRTNVVDGQLVIMVRERALPLFFLSDWLVNDPTYIADKEATSHVVVVNSGGRQIGFVVDQLVGQEEVVIKPLGANLQGVAGLAGATITGDGKIALILDVPGLMNKYAG